MQRSCVYRAFGSTRHSERSTHAAAAIRPPGEAAAQATGQPLVHTPHLTPPSDPMTHGPSLLSFYTPRVQNNHMAGKQSRESRSKSGCPVPQPRLLSPRQSCAPVFNVINYSGPPSPRILKQPCGIGVPITLGQAWLCR